MSVAAKVSTLDERDARPIALSRRVAQDFAALLGVALGIGLIAGLGMVLAVLLLA